MLLRRHHHVLTRVEQRKLTHTLKRRSLTRGSRGHGTASSGQGASRPRLRVTRTSPTNVYQNLSSRRIRQATNRRRLQSNVNPRSRQRRRLQQQATRPSQRSRGSEGRDNRHTISTSRHNRSASRTRRRRSRPDPTLPNLASRRLPHPNDRTESFRSHTSSRGYYSRSSNQVTGAYR